VRGGFLSYSPAAPVDGVYTRNALSRSVEYFTELGCAGSDKVVATDYPEAG